MRFLSLILIAVFLILVFANEIGRLQTDVFNQIDHDQDQGQVEPKLQDDQDQDQLTDPSTPGPLSAPQHIYSDPNTSNFCILGVPSDPNRPQRVNPHCA